MISRDELIKKVDNYLRRYVVPTLNGKKEEPLCAKSASYAQAFLSLLDDKYILPEIVPLPTGKIGLEWLDDGNFFALNIDSGGNLRFLSLWDQDEGRGVELFNGGEIPKLIIEHLENWKVSD